jgi:hypothetical protein
MLHRLAVAAFGTVALTIALLGPPVTRPSSAQDCKSHCNGICAAKAAGESRIFSKCMGQCPSVCAAKKAGKSGGKMKAAGGRKGGA